MSDTLVAAKRCRHCLGVKPLDDFRFRSRAEGTRFNQCNSCHAKAERERAANSRLSVRNDLLGKFATEAKNAPNYRRVAIVTDMMVDRFGGLEGFVDAWANQVRMAAATNPGGKRVLDFFLAMTKLLKAEEPDGEDFAEMSSEDLEATIWDVVRRQVERDPSIVIRAAEQLGWTIIPPETEGPTGSPIEDSTDATESF